jgi:hypothetical protein
MARAEETTSPILRSSDPNAAVSSSIRNSSGS